MKTIYLPALAFRFRSALIDRVMRDNWRHGWQMAFRYYYVED